MNEKARESRAKASFWREPPGFPVAVMTTTRRALLLQMYNLQTNNTEVHQHKYTDIQIINKKGEVWQNKAASYKTYSDRLEEAV